MRDSGEEGRRTNKERGQIENSVLSSVFLHSNIIWHGSRLLLPCHLLRMRTDCCHVCMLPVFSVAALARNRQAFLVLNGSQQGHNKVTTGSQQGHNRVTIGSCKTRAKQIEALRKGYVVYIKRVLFFWACIFARVLRDPIVTLLWPYCDLVVTLLWPYCEVDVKCGLGATTNTKYISKASFLGFSSLGMPWHLGYDHFALFGTYFHVLLMYSHICSPGG